MARRFFYVCAGMLMLALSYHLGASSAGAQVGASISGFAGFSGDGYLYAMTPNGDVYAHRTSANAMYPNLVYMGNFWSGSPTPAQRATFGQVKARYAPSTGTPTSETNDR